MTHLKRSPNNNHVLMYKSEIRNRFSCKIDCLDFPGDDTLVIVTLVARLLLSPVAQMRAGAFSSAYPGKGSNE
jgi:hypothetical protein